MAPLEKTLASSPGSVANVSASADRTMECPHCFEPFDIDQLHFIAKSPSLAFDHRLASGAMRRFLPSQFTIDGNAIDPGGALCTETACPHCHLKVPRLLAIRRTLPLSVAGAPSSGKSFLLGAMAHVMRRVATQVGLRFDDVDIEANQVLLDYENRMFNQSTPEHWVWLAKTDLSGGWYSTVYFGRHDDARYARTYPKPFLFRVDPFDNHPGQAAANEIGRALCFYDNAGEHFEVGGDQYNFVTGHLQDSQGLIFVFDPTQDQDFRKACRDRSSDPQFKGQVVKQQDILYGNVMNRLVTLRRMRADERVKMPLVVALTKFDSWSFLLDTASLPSPYVDGGDGIKRFDMRVVQAVSRACREMLVRLAPRVVSAIESRCEPAGILYTPVSATGCGPAGVASLESYPFDPLTFPPPPMGTSYFLAGSMQPMWAEVPLLAMLAQTAPQLLPGGGG